MAEIPRLGRVRVLGVRRGLLPTVQYIADAEPRMPGDREDGTHGCIPPGSGRQTVLILHGCNAAIWQKQRLSAATPQRVSSGGRCFGLVADAQCGLAGETKRR